MSNQVSVTLKQDKIIEISPQIGEVISVAGRHGNVILGISDIIGLTDALSSSNGIILAGNTGATLNVGSGGTLGSAAFTSASAYQPAGSYALTSDLTTLTSQLGSAAYTASSAYQPAGNYQPLSSTLTTIAAAGPLSSGAYAAAFNPASPGAIGEISPNTGRFTTVSMPTLKLASGGNGILRLSDLTNNYFSTIQFAGADGTHAGIHAVSAIFNQAVSVVVPGSFGTIIAATSHGLSRGDQVTFDTDDTYPVGLEAGVHYTVFDVLSDFQFRLETAISSTGSGNLTFSRDAAIYAESADLSQPITLVAGDIYGYSYAFRGSSSSLTAYARTANTATYYRNDTELDVLEIGDSYLNLDTASDIRFGAIGGTADLFLLRDASNVLALRNGTTAQEQRWYGTYTDASNYRRAYVKYYAGNGEIQFGAEGLGTGANPNVSLNAPANLYLTATSVRLSSGLLFQTDNAYDIGASAANRPRNAYFAGSATAFGDFIAVSSLKLGSQLAGFKAPAANIIQAFGNTGTDLNRMQFGGTTSSYPALRTSSFYSNTFTATAATPGVFTTASAHGFAVGDLVTHTNSGGALPNPVISGTTYYIQSVPSTTTYTLAATLGGAAIATTTTGTGTNTVVRAVALYVRAADNSADASLAVGSITSSGNIATPNSATIGSTAVQLYYPGGAWGGIQCNGGAWGLALAANGVSIGATLDTIITRDAANTLAMRNGTNSQSQRWYSTYTDSSNYARLSLSQSGGIWTLFNEVAGTGAGTELAIGTSTANALRFYTQNTHRWNVNSAGHLVAVLDNTYDIGANGANRPRTGYYGSSLIVADFSSLVNGRLTIATGTGSTTRLTSNVGAGILILDDNAGGFNRINFGGSTVSFPALKSTSAVSALSCTATFASPGVFTTASAHGFVVGDVVTFANSPGATPSNIAAGRKYHILTVPSGTTFTLSIALGGTAINTTSTGGTFSVSRAVGLYCRTADNSLYAVLYAGEIFSSRISLNPNDSSGVINRSPYIWSRDNNRLTDTDADGTNMWETGPSYFTIDTATVFGWGAVSGSADTILLRDAANTLAMKNGTNAQEIRLYGTFTDGSNFERLSINKTGLGFYLEAQKLGTGVDNSVGLKAGATQFCRFFIGVNTEIVRIGTNGMIFPIDNTYDLGAINATRPRSGYFGTSLAVGSVTTQATTLDVVANSTNATMKIQNLNASGWSAFDIYGSDGVQKGGFGYGNATASFSPGVAYFFSNAADINISAGANSSLQNIRFTTNNQERFRITSAGNITASTDNAYDIGASGANRPRNIYVASSIQAGSQISAGNYVQAASYLQSSISSGINVYLGPAGTSSYVAIKRVNTTMEVRLADDSAYAATQTLYDRFGSGSPEGVVTAPIGAVFHRTDGGAGTSFYVKESGTGNTGWVAK